MGWRFTKQPNNQLALFNDVLDDFTHLNMTEKEARTLAEQKCEMGNEHIAKRKVDIALADSNLARWDDALRQVRLNHGATAVEAVIHQVHLMCGLQYFYVYDLGGGVNGCEAFVDLADAQKFRDQKMKEFGHLSKYPRWRLVLGKVVEELDPHKQERVA